MYCLQSFFCCILHTISLEVHLFVVMLPSSRSITWRPGTVLYFHGALSYLNKGDDLMDTVRQRVLNITEHARKMTRKFTYSKLLLPLLQTGMVYSMSPQHRLLCFRSISMGRGHLKSEYKRIRGHLRGEYKP